MTTRISPNQTPDAQTQQQLDGVQKMLGMTPNLYKTIANSPAALSFALGSNAALAKGLLGAQLREKIALTVAGLNGCDYCASAHTKIGSLHKIDAAELADNLKGVSSDAKTQAALTFVAKTVKTRAHLADADVKAVRDAGYSDGEIIELIAAVAANIFTNYVNDISGAQIDFPLVSTSDVAKAA